MVIVECIDSDCHAQGMLERNLHIQINAVDATGTLALPRTNSDHHYHRARTNKLEFGLVFFFLSFPYHNSYLRKSFVHENCHSLTSLFHERNEHLQGNKQKHQAAFEEYHTLK